MEPTQQTIGPYQIQEELGRGGTAVVYRALDTRDHKEVALKVLLPQFATDSAIMRRFVKEGQSAARLQHENIVRIYESSEIDGNYYIAMELIKGCTLSEYLVQREQLISIDEAIDILWQIAAGLDFAHSLGFLHRDIKLGNILMADDGRILLSDFGAAKHMYSENTMITAIGHTIGTPSYMSPEQVTGTQIDGRSDVYSLGVIAYKLFTGRLPFRAHSQPELLHKIAYEEPVSPESINAELPSHIVNSLCKVLTKDSAQRYESAGIFVAALVAGQTWKSDSVTLHTLTSKVTGGRAPVGWLQQRRRLTRVALGLVVAAFVYFMVFVPDNALRGNLNALWTEYEVAERLSSVWATTVDTTHLPTQPSSVWERSTSTDPLKDNDSLVIAASWVAEVWDGLSGAVIQGWGDQASAWLSTLDGANTHALPSVAPTDGNKPSIPPITPNLFPEDIQVIDAASNIPQRLGTR